MWTKDAITYMAYRSIGSEYLAATVVGKGVAYMMYAATKAGIFPDTGLWGSRWSLSATSIEYSSTNVTVGGTWVSYVFGCSDDGAALSLQMLRATTVFAFASAGTNTLFLWNATMGCGHIDPGIGHEGEWGRRGREDPVAAMSEGAFRWFAEGFYDANPRYLGFWGARLIDSADYAVYMDVNIVSQGLPNHGTMATLIFRGTNTTGKTINPAKIILYGTRNGQSGAFGASGLAMATLQKYFHDSSWLGLDNGDVWEGTVLIDFKPLGGDVFTETPPEGISGPGLLI